jgi:hypothetical protein
VTVSIFYPYQTEPEGLILEIEPVGAEIPRSADGSIFRVYEAETGQVDFRASVAIFRETREKVFPPEEQENPPLQVHLLCRSIESRKRETIPLEGDGEFFHGDFPLQVKGWFGRIDFQAIIARGSTNKVVPEGFAGERGMLLSWSNIIQAVIDEPKIPPGIFKLFSGKDFRMTLNSVDMEKTFLLWIILLPPRFFY